jgi:glycosyltransferase involved in cell wall biosynthesis
MTDTPQVSVLLPCRNAASTLDEALASLADQTFRDFEIIAVDDGSTDETPALLDEWRKRDARVRVICTPPGGIVAALDTAAAHVRGEWLARMDADDIAMPKRLERQMAFLDAYPDLVACGTRVRYVPKDQVRDGARRYEQWINSVVSWEEIERDLFVECPIPHPSLVISRTVFERVGGYRDAGWPEDYDLILRLWESGFRFGKVSDVLLEWREGPERLSRTDGRYGEEAFRRCKAHFLKHRIAGRAVVVCGAGPIGKAFTKALKKEGHTVEAFVDLDPRKIGQTIDGAPVVHPSTIDNYRAAYVVAAVGQRDARTEIRATLRAAGFREPQDACAVA